MTDLNRASILITGAAGGFGQHFIRQSLAAGGRVIATDVNGAALDSALTQIRQEVKGGEILQCIQADLSTREGCERVKSEVGVAPDVLINNAGIGMHGRFDETPADQWERLISINLLAPMRLVSLFAPEMIARRQGHIVNISSVAGWIGTAGLAPYSASKFGLRGFGEALYDELKAYNIKVTNVYPFYSRTPILDSPRFGTLQAATLPDSMTSDPADVVREVIEGIVGDKPHIFPDPTAKRLHLIKRFVPGLLPFLTRRLAST